MMKALLVAVACGLVLLTASPSYGQDPTANFVAEPAAGSQTDPAGGFFLLEAEPGAEVRQEIGLRNDSAVPLEIELGAVDAVTGQLGGASYALTSETPTRVGTWIALERTTVTLAPEASAVVPFRVAVPQDAESGQHLAGISISVPQVQDTAGVAGEGQAGASIDVQTRRIIAVQVNLPGPAEPELVIGGVSPVARPDGLYLEVAVENTGRALTKGAGVIRVEDNFEREFDVDTFVPRTSIGYPIKWRDADDGEYAAAVEIRYGDRTARWEGTFTVGDEVLAELSERQVTPNADSDAAGLPRLQLIGAAVAGVLLLGAGGRTAARMRRPRGRHGRD